MVTIAKSLATAGPETRRHRKVTAADGRKTSARLFSPILAPLLGNRLLARILFAAAILQVLLVAGGWMGWSCPVRSSVGIPCPGCGMTTAVGLLCTGKWSAALHVHAFAPLVLLALLLIGLAAILPPSCQKRLSQAVAALERRTGITALALMGMMVYWLLRLIGNEIL